MYSQYQITNNQSKISNQFKMSDLYYVTKIRGCIALKDIKKGTLIVSESPKLIAKGNPWSLDPTCKGQIMSKCIYEIINFPRYQQKHLIDFCPGRFYRLGMYIRVRPRFFDQVGHQTTNASIRNKYFFNK